MTVDVSEPDDPAEREVDKVAERVLHMSRPAVAPAADSESWNWVQYRPADGIKPRERGKSMVGDESEVAGKATVAGPSTDLVRETELRAWVPESDYDSYHGRTRRHNCRDDRDGSGRIRGRRWWRYCRGRFTLGLPRGSNRRKFPSCTDHRPDGWHPHRCRHPDAGGGIGQSIGRTRDQSRAAVGRRPEGDGCWTESQLRRRRLPHHRSRLGQTVTRKQGLRRLLSITAGFRGRTSHGHWLRLAADSEKESPLRLVYVLKMEPLGHPSPGRGRP